MRGIEPGDTAFLLVCTALVLMMTPALALFYGGGWSGNGTSCR